MGITFLYDTIQSKVISGQYVTLNYYKQFNGNEIIAIKQNLTDVVIDATFDQTTGQTKGTFSGTVFNTSTKISVTGSFYVKIIQELH